MLQTSPICDNTITQWTYYFAEHHFSNCSNDFQFRYSDNQTRAINEVAVYIGMETHYNTDFWVHKKSVL